jgi:hypothetical protein
VYHSDASDLFWVQAVDRPSRAAMEVVTLGSDHPRDARWSLTAVEIVPVN